MSQENLFHKRDLNDIEKIHLDELTYAEIKELKNPIELSEKIKNLLNTEYILIVSNEDTKVIRIIPLKSKNIIKIVIYLEEVSEFIRDIISFYNRNNIEIVYTSGICFRKNKINQEDCIYEAYLDLDSCCKEFTKTKIIDEIEKIKGVQKIFIINI